MWIQELNIKNFGKFADKRIELGPGINLIYGENESGKSTMHAFIRGCLYGVRKMRGRASRMDVFNRYQPWENPAYYAGSMRFVCGEKVFRLERDFTKGLKGGLLICETDGEQLSLEEGDLEILLGNVGEAAFDNTVSIGQLKSETDEGLAVELNNYMANMEGTGNASIRVEKALLVLKEEKKKYEKSLEKLIDKEEESLRQIVARIHFLEEEKEKSRSELTKVRSQLEQYIEEDKREGARLQAEKSAEAKRKKSLLGRFFEWLKRLFARILGRKEEDREDFYDDVYNDTRQKALLMGKQEQLESMIQEKNLQIENCKQDIMMQKELSQTEEKRRLREEIQACELARDRILDVVHKMRTSAGQFLKKRTSEIFSEITDGRYNWVEIQEDLRLSVHSAEHFVSAGQLSRGTIWQLYFALRMAANEVLCQDENLPVILDDAFVMYDEKRLGQVLAWLAKQKKQVIIFTCQKREKEWLVRTQTPFCSIDLKVEKEAIWHCN